MTKEERQAEQERKKRKKERNEKMAYAKKVGGGISGRLGRVGSVGGGSIGGIAKIAIVTLIIANVFSLFMLNGQPITFSAFLEMLSNAPQISFGLNIQSWVLNLPEYLNWLEIALNPIMRILGLFAMLSEMAINLVAFLGYFIGWFFGVV